jgi:energy-coupling factor transport system ATP-binding protein
MEPAILVMDEPTSNLDPVGSAEVFGIVRRLNRDAGMTVVIAEHDVEALAANVDRIVVLTEGHIAFQGGAPEVLGRVEELAALGLRAPQVTELAHVLAPDDRDLPVTIADALAWLEARA